MNYRITVGSLAALLAVAGVSSAQPAPSAELTQLEARLVDLRQKFNDRHPEVIALNEKIRAQRQADADSQLPVQKYRADGGDVEVAKKHLEDLRQKFTDKHPDVVVQTQRVKELEQKGVR